MSLCSLKNHFTLKTINFYEDDISKFEDFVFPCAIFRPRKLICKKRKQGFITNSEHAFLAVSIG